MRCLLRCCGLGIVGVTLILGVGIAQDTKKEKDKIKGSVPIGWKALKLSKDQAKKIQLIDIQYKTKIAELTAKIDELKEQSRIEMTKQLTDEQKTTLAKLSGLEVKDKDKDKAPPKEKNEKTKEPDKK